MENQLSQKTNPFDQKELAILIEEKTPFSNSMKPFLETNGFNVEHLLDGHLVKKLAFNQQPILVIINVIHPELDVASICQYIRTIFSSPLLVLSPNGDENDHILALKKGADDYISKPASENFVKVKINALLRRYKTYGLLSTPIENKIEAGDITLFPLSQKCQINGQRLHLSTFEFRLLGLLVANVGQIMSRDSIYHYLLGREYNGEERTIDVRVSKLRDKLSSHGVEASRIETVWGKGYMFNDAPI